MTRVGKGREATDTLQFPLQWLSCEKIVFFCIWRVFAGVPAQSGETTRHPYY